MKKIANFGGVPRPVTMVWVDAETRNVPRAFPVWPDSYEDRSVRQAG